MTYHDSISINSHSDKAIPVQCVPYSRRTSLTPVSHENALNIWWWIRKRKCCQLMSDNTLIGQTMIFYGSWLSTITEEFFPLTLFTKSCCFKEYSDNVNLKAPRAQNSQFCCCFVPSYIIFFCYFIPYKRRARTTEGSGGHSDFMFFQHLFVHIRHTHTHAMFIQQPTRNNNILSL